MYQQVKWHTHTLWQFGVNHQSQTMGSGQILENPHSSSQNVRLSSHSLPYEIVVQSHSHIWLFVTPWTEAHQASLPFTISLSLLKLMSIESVMPSNHFLLYLSFYSCSQLFPALGSFPMFASGDQNTGASASASVLPMSIEGWFPLRLAGFISLLSKRLSRVFFSTTVGRHRFFGALPSLRSSSHNCMWPPGRL